MKQIFILLCIFSVFFPQKANAQEVVFSDNFSGALNNWTVVRNKQWIYPSLPCMNGSNPAQWSIVNGRLEMSIHGSSCITEIIPTISSPLEIENYEYTFDITLHDSITMDRNYLLKWIDVNNWYGMKILGNSFYLQKVVEGGVYSIPYTAVEFPFTANTTYTIRNLVEKDHIRIWIDDQLVLDFYDQSPFLMTGQVGLQASVGAISRSKTSFDNVTLKTSLNDINYTVNYLSQMDSRWKDIEYDHASQWSDTPTIGRYGCALTAAAMLFQSQSIPETPETINRWLLTQSDGYIGKGLVNWIALTRLMHTYNLTDNVQELEFSYTTSPEVVKEHMNNNQPFIIQTTNHFVYGAGYSFNQDTFKIADPLDQSRLTLDTPFISARLFTVSNTDLSYVLIVVDEDTQITSRDHTIALQTVVEGPYIEGGDSKTLYYIQKPDNGTYALEFHHQGDAPMKFTSYIYAQDSTLQTSTYTGRSETYTDTFLFTIDKESESTVTRSITAQTFMEDILHAWKTDENHQVFLYYLLFQYANELNILINLNDKIRYTALIQNFIEMNEESFSPFSYTQLLNDLYLLEGDMR